MAFKFTLTAFKKVGGTSFRSRPTIAMWDIENAQIPKGFQVDGLVNTIRTNLQTAGFGCSVPLRAYCYGPVLKEEIRESLKEQGVLVQNVAYKTADEHIASFVKEWVRKHPDGGNVVLLSGDFKLAKDCKGGRFFDLYISARIKSMGQVFIPKVKPIGVWRWHDMIRPGAMLVPPEIIQKEIEEIHRERKEKREKAKK